MSRKPLLYMVLIIFVFWANGCTTYTRFYGKTFSSIPNEGNIPKVHRLNLSNQDLDVLPTSISGLENLKMLDLSGNPNLDLNTAFKKLRFPKNLEILSLDSLDISKLPESIKEFSNLKQLSLAFNPNLDIEHAVDLITNLPIEFINLKGNAIDTLPENVRSLKSIKDLNLSFNRLKGKKNFEILSELPNLYSLWLDHNKLKALPTTIGKLNQIRFLYIDHNYLRELPMEMSTMKTWVIHAGYNNFVKLPEVFTSMRSLFLVHINNNDIKSIPASYEVKKYPLAGLIMNHNPIKGEERQKAEKLFKGFFILSFEQN